MQMTDADTEAVLRPVSGPSEPLPARWGAEGNYTVLSLRLLFGLLLRSEKHGFRPGAFMTATVPRMVPWQQRILKLLP